MLSIYLSIKDGRTDEQNSYINIQGDHSPDNVKFPDGLWPSSAALGMLIVIHIIPILVLLSVVGVEMPQCMIGNQSKMHKLSNFKY